MAPVQLQGGEEGESLSCAQQSRPGCCPSSRGSAGVQPIGSCHPDYRLGPASASGLLASQLSGPLTALATPNPVPSTRDPARSHGWCLRREAVGGEQGGILGKSAPSQGVNRSSSGSEACLPPCYLPVRGRGGPASDRGHCLLLVAL